MDDLSPVLSIQGLAKSFSTPVFRDLSLEIKSQQSVALVGANGAGKSTFIKIILGLVGADSGSVKIWGQDPRNSRVLERVGYLPEVSGFWPELSAREMLFFASKFTDRNQEELVERRENLLSVLGLKNRGARRMDGYSKGMLQRSGLANLLLHDPEFLVLDEPMSGLDPRAQAKLRDILSRLRERGKTLLISSHSLEDIQKLCDRVIVLEKGAKVLDGETSQVLSELERKYQSSEPWDEDPLGDDSGFF
ncbi:ABC transporter ATP-binding protein [bacterium]|nr:ABC transporter ATP-binding protein [bacterium]